MSGPQSSEHPVQELFDRFQAWLATVGRTGTRAEVAAGFDRFAGEFTRLAELSVELGRCCIKTASELRGDIEPADNTTGGES